MLRRCSVSPSPQLCRCLPKRRRAPTHGRRQHSEWSVPSPPGGTACLAIGTPRWRPPLSSGPTSVWRQPSLSADLRGRQRAAQSFWSSGCGPCICAMLLRDTATLRLDLPPPRAVLAGSPPDRGRVWWEPWARIQAGVSRQRESRRCSRRLLRKSKLQHLWVAGPLHWLPGRFGAWAGHGERRSPARGLMCPGAAVDGASCQDRMYWIAWVCCCTTENCWAKPSTVSLNSPTAPSFSEDVNPSPDAAIDILSTDGAPNEMLGAPWDGPAKSPGNRTGCSLREE